MGNFAKLLLCFGSFYPFSYYPLSGKLIHYDAAEIEIEYELPSYGSVEAQRIERLKWDDKAFERALDRTLGKPDVKVDKSPDVMNYEQYLEKLSKDIESKTPVLLEDKKSKELSDNFIVSLTLFCFLLSFASFFNDTS